jgi:hypothetical protein
MAKDTNETVIQIDHQTGVASIWTCNRRILGKLRRMRAKELRKQIGGAWFELPEKGISFRKPRKKASFPTTPGASPRTDPESHEVDDATSD